MVIVFIVFSFQVFTVLFEKNSLYTTKLLHSSLDSATNMTVIIRGTDGCVAIVWYTTKGKKQPLFL